MYIHIFSFLLINQTCLVRKKKKITEIAEATVPFTPFNNSVSSYPALKHEPLCFLLC